MKQKQQKNLTPEMKQWLRVRADGLAEATFSQYIQFAATFNLPADNAKDLVCRWIRKSL